MNTYLKKPPLYLLLIFSVIYLIATIKSNGYYYPDEHFQIIEFAGLKAKWNSEKDLPWEYAAKIRPTLQPLIALIIFKSAGLFQLKDPFLLATILRLASAIFSFSAIYFFICRFIRDVDRNYRLVFVLLSFCLWFLPSLNVRFSSENWSGCCLLIAIGLIRFPKKSTWHFILIGILFGLAFEFRFQSAFAIAGLAIWLIVIGKTSFPDLTRIATGICLMILAGLALDSLYYGTWVFTPYQYFKMNILEGIASAYGTSPWYMYFNMMFYAPTILIGMAILTSIVWLAFFNPRNIVLWAVIPFIFFHSVVAHKELRFLFPIINFIPYLLISAYQSARLKLIKNRIAEMFSGAILAAIYLINLAGLVMLIFKPAGNGSVNMMQYLSRNYTKENHLIVYCLKNNNPYIIGAASGLKAIFYCPKNLVIKNIHPRNLQQPKSNQLYIMPRSNIVEGRMLERSGYHIEKLAIPMWIIEMNKFYRVFEEGDVPVLYTQNNNGNKTN